MQNKSFGHWVLGFVPKESRRILRNPFGRICLVLGTWSLGFILTGCGGSPQETTTTTTTTVTVTSTTATTSSTTTSTVASPHFLVGTWVGTWEDTYNVTGSLNATISQSGLTLSGTGSIGLAGLNAFGFDFSTMESGTAVGSISGNSGTFTFNSATVGLGSGTIDGNTISGTGEVVAFAEGNFMFIGTIEADGKTINAFFDFLAPGAGEGTARVSKQ